MPNAVGRPRIHDRAAVMAIVCERLASGQLQKDIADDVNISSWDISTWGHSEEFRQQYTRARESQALVMADEVIRIADGVDLASQARVVAMVSAIAGVEDEDKERILASLTREAVQRDRIRVDARKWLTAKVYPRVFAERQQIDVKHGLDDSLSGLIAAAFTGATTIEGAAKLELPAGAPVSVVESPELTRDTEG